MTAASLRRGFIGWKTRKILILQGHGESLGGQEGSRRLPGPLCEAHPCLCSTAGTSGHRNVMNSIAHCFAHTVKFAILKTRGSFLGEKPNLSPAGPALLSSPWLGGSSTVGLAELKCSSPVRTSQQSCASSKRCVWPLVSPKRAQGPTWPGPALPWTGPSAPVASAASQHGVPVALGGEGCQWGAQQCSWSVQRVEIPKS